MFLLLAAGNKDKGKTDIFKKPRFRAVINRPGKCMLARRVLIIPCGSQGAKTTAYFYKCGGVLFHRAVVLKLICGCHFYDVCVVFEAQHHCDSSGDPSTSASRVLSLHGAQPQSFLGVIFSPLTLTLKLQVSLN